MVGLVGLVSPPVEVETLAGQRLVGALTRLEAGQLALQTADGQLLVRAEDLLSVSPKLPAEPSQPGTIAIGLVDGSVFSAAEYTVRQGQARIALQLGKTLELSTRQIRWVRLQAQTDALAEPWTRLMEMPAEGDLLVTRKAEALDYHTGTIRDVTDSAVKFLVEGELLPVQRDKVFGLVYYHPAGPDLPEAICRVSEATGANWTARTIRLSGDALEWVTPAGLTMTCPLAQVRRIDFSQGRIIYLSEQKPESITWTPYFGTSRDLPARNQFFAPRLDRSLGPGPLELGGRAYSKGLALHSRTHVVYRLPGKFRRFKALVGIDDRVQPGGNVRLVIQGDDRVLLETTVAGSDPPKHVDLELTGVRRLSILVDFGENLDFADHLDLAEARILK